MSTFQEGQEKCLAAASSDVKCRQGRGNEGGDVSQPLKRFSRRDRWSQVQQAQQDFCQQRL